MGPPRIETYRNGRRLAQYDTLREWLERVQQHFIEQSRKGYRFFPDLPEDWLGAVRIYEECDDDEERRLIVLALVDELVSALRFWTVDRDKAWGRGQWSAFRYG